ncbi:putative molybdenum carrier protein [Solemya velum gill symbiont]|uniref:putative molybdenum carrier protein n=1 Tax=Solemya velum gill symbiont TaxID=2340 RepID=UPI000998D40D|nr:putative molybdenum carrier protein [Solemya velum gill symbiont]OOZ12332.1 hypothetical protein BOW25_08315 [Solemya velum gill symbiont]
MAKRRLIQGTDITRIVSGGQTGADRAALDYAIEHGIPHGGWCPKGRLAEDGELDSKYLLVEMPSANYRQRTRQNVVDSDGTLIINQGELRGGTRATHEFAEALEKPYLVIQVEDDALENRDVVLSWLQERGIAVLNVAGPRGSKCPEIYRHTFQLLKSLLTDP